MSSLIFHTEQNQVMIATDTLATSPDGRPFKFTTKAFFLLPHLRMIIAGTGAGGFLGRWFIRVNDNLVVRGIDNLDYHAPGSLTAIWRGYKQEVSVPNNVTATVYHFGFSETSDLIHSFAYRSANDFASERLGYGLGMKPEFPAPDGYQLPNDFKSMMDQQRSIQASKPKSETVYVGGEIQIHHLVPEGIQVYTLDRFEDFESDEAAIYQNFDTSTQKTPGW